MDSNLKISFFDDENQTFKIHSRPIPTIWSVLSLREAVKKLSREKKPRIRPEGFNTLLVAQLDDLCIYHWLFALISTERRGTAMY